jgi:SAM-dependent methyltransferase
MWAGVAPQWRAHADEVDSRSAGLTAAMLDGVGLQGGERVLELACGPGGTGIEAAKRVGSEGRVVLSDVAESMAVIAGERAALLGLRNVLTATLDLEDIDEPESTFDVVLCREGLMFAVEPARALSEIFRVLRPGGRFAAAVWGPRVENPWLGLLLDVLSAELGTTMPPPGVPGPFSLADAEVLAALVDAAGFVDGAVVPVSVPHRSSSFEEYFQLTSDVAGPLAAVIGGLPDETRDAVRARLRSELAPYTSAEGVDIPGVSLLITARGPV